MREPHEVEHLEHATAALRTRGAHRLEREVDVLGNRAVAHQVEVLEHHADVVPGSAQRVTLEFGDAMLADGDRAAIRALERVDAAQQRRFTGARLANDTEDAAAGNVQRHILQRVDGALAAAV